VSAFLRAGYLLLFVGVAFLLDDDDEELLALFLEHGDVGSRLLQLAGHRLHLLAGLVDL